MQVEMAYDHAMDFFNDTIFTINQLGLQVRRFAVRKHEPPLNALCLQEVLTEQGFQEFKTRDTVRFHMLMRPVVMPVIAYPQGRYDMVVPGFETEHFSFFNKSAPWLPLVKTHRRSVHALTR
jgi:hypothetical protein